MRVQEGSAQQAAGRGQGLCRILALVACSLVELLGESSGGHGLGCGIDRRTVLRLVGPVCDCGGGAPTLRLSESACHCITVDCAGKEGVPRCISRASQVAVAAEGDRVLRRELPRLRVCWLQLLRAVQRSPRLCPGGVLGSARQYASTVRQTELAASRLRAESQADGSRAETRGGRETRHACTRGGIERLRHTARHARHGE